jgi:serine/threonine-protein kinase
MEWLQGETLAARLQRERLPAPRALDVLVQLVDALEAAHEKQIVHRDLKPQNIVILERKRASAPDQTQVKLLDFGIAKLADSDPNVPKTRSGVAMGTAGYMSPEQARGKNVDHRTDIYALGCVAYEVLVGRLPFVADTAIDILAMHLASAPPSLRTFWREAPAGLERILMQMLAKEPDGRPSLQQVRAVFDGSLRSLTPSMGIPVGPRPQRRAPWLPWVGAAAVVLAIVGTALFGYLRAERRQAAAPRPMPTSVLPIPMPTTTRALALAPSPVGSTSATPPPTSVLLVHAPNGAVVSVDGREAVARDGSVTVEVSGGVHDVVVTAARRQPFHDRVRVAAGATAEVRALLRPMHGMELRETAAQPEPQPEQPKQPQPQPQPQPQSSQPEQPKQPPPQPQPRKGDYTLDPF